MIIAFEVSKPLITDEFRTKMLDILYAASPYGFDAYTSAVATVHKIICAKFECGDDRTVDIILNDEVLRDVLFDQMNLAVDISKGAVSDEDLELIRD